MLPEYTFLTTRDSLKNYKAINAGLSVIAGAAGYLRYGVPGAVAGASAWAIATLVRPVFDKLLPKSFKEYGASLGLSVMTGTVGGLYVTQAFGQITHSFAFRATPFIKALVTTPSLASVAIVAKPALISVGIAVGVICAIGLASNTWKWLNTAP